MMKRALLEPPPPRRGDLGQSAVEFALAAPFLIAFIMFMVDIAFLGFNYVSATNAVREGARCGAIGGSNSAITNRVTTTAGSLSQAVTFPTPVARGSTIGSDVTVSAHFVYKMLTPVNMLPGLTLGDIPFDKAATMRMEAAAPYDKTC